MTVITPREFYFNDVREITGGGGGGGIGPKNGENK